MKFEVPNIDPAAMIDQVIGAAVLALCASDVFQMRTLQHKETKPAFDRSRSCIKYQFCDHAKPAIGQFQPFERFCYIENSPQYFPILTVETSPPIRWVATHAPDVISGASALTGTRRYESLTSQILSIIRISDAELSTQRVKV